MSPDDMLRESVRNRLEQIAATPGDGLVMLTPEEASIILARVVSVDVDRLRASLRWALIALAENAATTHVDGTPDHTCDFVTNPEKGGCDFHEEYWTAAELVGLLPTEET